MKERISRRTFLLGAAALAFNTRKDVFAQSQTPTSPETVDVVTIGGNSNATPTPTEVQTTLPTPTPVESSLPRSNVDTVQVETINKTPSSPENTSVQVSRPSQSSSYPSQSDIETADVVRVGNEEPTSNETIQAEVETPELTQPEAPNDVPENEPQLPLTEEFVQTAEDIKDAFDFANSGYTSDFPGLAEILRNFLAERGYSDEELDMFEKRRQGSLVYSGEILGRATQCLGYVGTVVSLWRKTTNESSTLRYERAGNINDLYSGGEPLPIGDLTFQAVGNGYGFDIKKGDIAVCGTAALKNDHIGIVYDVTEGDPATMIMIESNGNGVCRVTNDIVRKKAPYTFYRLVQE